MPDETPAADAPNLTPGILGRALDKFHAAQDGLASLEPVTPPAQPPPAPPAASDDDDEAEIAALRAEDVRTGKGLPISQNAREKFSKLETSRNKWRTKAQEFEAKMADFQKKLDETNSRATDIQNADEFKALKTENEKLKETQDLLFFEQSDDWKQTFEAPIAAISDRINGIIKSSVKTISPQAANDLTRILSQANVLLGNPDAETEFDTLVDSITDGVLTGTAGSKLSMAMQEVWKLAAARQQAKADKAAAREAITTRKLALQEQTGKTLEEGLAIQEAAFEQTQLGKTLSKTLGEQYQYAEGKEIGKKLLTSALNIFLKTGKATPELTELLHHATLKRVHDKEREYLVQGYTAMETLSQQQATKIAELEKRIKELRGGTGEAPTSGDDKKPKTLAKSTGLANRLEEAINSFGR